MSALQELQLLEIMCSCFQEQSRDTVRQLMFSALFSLQGNQADESRMALLGKLVSMAIAVGRVPILECAATWLQVRTQTGVGYPFNPVPRSIETSSVKRYLHLILFLTRIYKKIVFDPALIQTHLHTYMCI